MIEKVKNMRITMKLFSVILAVVVWLMLIYTVNPTISQYVKNVPVTFYGEDALAERGLVLINKDETDTVNVKIRGARSSVIDALSAIRASVDVSDIDGVGTWREYATFDIGVSGVSVEGRSNTVINVVTDELLEKNIPVEVRQTGTEKNKQIIVASTAEKDSITIRGAKSELENIKSAVVTIDVSEIASDNRGSYKYHFIDNNDTEQEFTSLVNPPGSISIVNTVYERRTVDVELLLSKDRDKYTIDVKSLAKNKIDIGVNKDDIEAQKISKITYMFNPDDYKTGDVEYAVTAEVPDGIYIPVESANITAKLELMKLERKELELDVEVRNVMEGMTAMVTPNKVKLTVRAPEGAAEKIKAYADVSGLKAGHHELEVKTENDKGVIFEESAHIRVTINEKKG